MNIALKPTHTILVDLPNGATVRIAWDTHDGGLMLIGETYAGGMLAKSLTIQPRAANRVVIGVS